MKKVLFAISNLNGGGAEKVLVTILKNIDPQKIKVTLLLIFFEGNYIKDIPDYVEIKYLFKTRNSIIVRSIYKMFRYMSNKLIYKLFIKDKYDVEIAFLEGITTKLISGSNSDSKKIAWVHTDLSSNHLTRYYYKSVDSELEQYKKFNKIVCVSNDAKAGFENLFNYYNDIDVIYNPVDSKEIISLAEEETIKTDEFTVCTVGRLVEVKGYDRLIRVHSKLIGEGFCYKLLIVGTGPLKKELEVLCRELNVEDSVIFVGFQNNPYVYIKSSDIFVSSSKMEGFSLVVCEALVLGVPVISTRTTGPIEILENGKYGLLVENNEDGLYQGIKSFMENEKFRMHYQEMALKRKSFFDMNSVLEKIYSLID